jgi:hypothetical protein
LDNIERKPSRLERVFAKRKRANVTIGKIILLAIAVYIVAFIVPQALTALATAALTSVNSAVITLFQVVLAVIVVLAIVLLFLREAGITIAT